MMCQPNIIYEYIEVFGHLLLLSPFFSGAVAVYWLRPQVVCQDRAAHPFRDGEKGLSGYDTGSRAQIAALRHNLHHLEQRLIVRSWNLSGGSPLPI